MMGRLLHRPLLHQSECVADDSEEKAKTSQVMSVTHTNVQVRRSVSAAGSVVGVFWFS